MFRARSTLRVLPDTDTTSLQNWLFYCNKLPSKPYGDYIDTIHKQWFGNYTLLEQHHGYIQYLFPIRELGMNDASQPLTKHESELFRGNADVLRRMVMSYQLMLDFYGMYLQNVETGELKRNSNYVQRYAHLNQSFHNYLRITRILKSLGIMGFEHYKEQFITFVIHEVFEHNMMPNVQESLIRFWIPTLRSASKIQEMDKLVEYLSRGKRKIDRTKVRDAAVEEEQSWATQYYEKPKEFNPSQMQQQQLAKM